MDFWVHKGAGMVFDFVLNEVYGLFGILFGFFLPLQLSCASQLLGLGLFSFLSDLSYMSYSLVLLGSWQNTITRDNTVLGARRNWKGDEQGYFMT